MDLNCKFLFSCKTSDRCLIPNLARANFKELISSTNHYQKSISLSQENSNLLGYPSLPIIWTETAKFDNTCLFSIVCLNVANSYAAYNTKIMITVTMCYPAPWKKIWFRAIISYTVIDTEHNVCSCKKEWLDS